MKEGDALYADSAEIGGNVFLNNGFESTGTIRLPGVKIKGICLVQARSYE